MSTPTHSERPASSLTRRGFLAKAGLGALASYVTPTLLAAADESPVALPKPAGAFEISALELGHFERYTPEQTAEAYDQIGLDAEITVRKNGHIKPENAAAELPVLAATLAKRNRKIASIALDTVRPDEPNWPEVLKVAKQLGIVQYRHRGFKYELGKPLKPQIANFHSMAKEFAAANKEIGVQALYQTHATPVMAGGAVWDLDLILGDIDPRYFGVAFDTRHVMVEQGQSWPNAINLIAPRIACLCVKNFRWDFDKPIAVPMSEGIVKKDIVDQVIAAAGHVPICLHVEYFGLVSGPFESNSPAIAAFKADAAVLRGWLGIS